MLAFLPKLAPYGSGEQRKLLGGLLQYSAGSSVTLFGDAVHSLGKTRYAGSRPFGSVEEMEHLVGILRGRGFEQCRGQRRPAAPAFVIAQRGAHSLSCDIERAAFVAENIAPAAGPHRLAAPV